MWSKSRQGLGQLTIDIGQFTLLRHSFSLLITLLDIDGNARNWKDSNRSANILLTPLNDSGKGDSVDNNLRSGSALRPECRLHTTRSVSRR